MTGVAKQARATRLANTDRARERKREIAKEQALVKAAQAAVPHDRTAIARARDQRSYLTGEYVHRLTGSRLRLLDTKAPDAPRGAIAPETGPDGKALRYAVECVDHGTGPRFYATLREAERAVRQAPAWCASCAELLDARPRVRARNKLR
ncbi:MAG TPA: hypothetical protein VGG16_28675 [Streptosporangiaceae bacterium]|jgi:hypothetical protein